MLVDAPWCACDGSSRVAHLGRWCSHSTENIGILDLLTKGRLGGKETSGSSTRSARSRVNDCPGVDEDHFACRRKEAAAGDEGLQDAGRVLRSADVGVKSGKKRWRWPKQE